MSLLTFRNLLATFRIAEAEILRFPVALTGAGGQVVGSGIRCCFAFGVENSVSSSSSTPSAAGGGTGERLNSSMGIVVLVIIDF
ncbi:hypothetical protein LINPERPRIM_LOCUS43128 [Linum perenne]